MALLQCNFKSKILGMCSSVNVILPETEPPAGGFKTLWLLHGLSDDHTVWCRNTSLERYLRDLDLAVVMPAADRSFYSNAKVGGNFYWDYISEELPEVMRRLFRLSDKRENNFVAGLSMGGFGAFKLALNFPERLAYAGSFSGALNISGSVDSDIARRNERVAIEMGYIFGSAEQMRQDGCDLVYIVENIKDASKFPRLYQACGTEDFLIDENREFLAAARNAGLDLEYTEEPGAHEWGFWDRHVKIFIDRTTEIF